MRRILVVPNEEKHTVLDLFCGCGGLSLGFEQAGYKVLAGIDVWKDSLVTYQENHKSSKAIEADLMNLAPETVAKEIGTSYVDVIAGGPPCQGFSVAGKRIVDDERNKLYKSFVKMVAYFKPKAFVLENVPNILNMGGGIIKDAIIQDFSDLGYKVTTKVLLASNYGVPQNRRRAIFVGLLNGKTYEYPQPTTPVPITTAEALSDLPENTIAEGNPYPQKPQSEYQTEIRKGSNGVFNHEITIHTEQTQRIISMVPDGGNYKDLPQELQSKRNVHIAWTRLNSQKPSVTIDTGHRHHFHYKYNRNPTVRESARLQSFPDDFIFKCSKTSQLKQVGNAVPPFLAKAIAEQLKKYLNG
ncbi:MAG: DNA cytosine methyltransferase [Salinivirgaceae bacterium]|nr:DNA cytosine methyltransferase [Salinivirgaceae bacterium]